MKTLKQNIDNINITNAITRINNTHQINETNKINTIHSITQTNQIIRKKKKNELNNN